MNRKIKFVQGNYYHVYNRGVEKRKIFLGEKDYRRFLLLLSLCNTPIPVDVREHLREGQTFGGFENFERRGRLVDIGVYCLMPNHFHLLIKEKTDNGISTFMKKLGTAYAMYFNQKNNRNGSLFQGKFGAQLIDDDNYLKYIFAYIHLNPIKLIEPNWREKGIEKIDKAEKFLEGYRWSSYFAYIKKRQEDLILNKRVFPKYFDSAKEFNDFVCEFAKVRPSQE